MHPWLERLARHHRFVPVLAMLLCAPALLGGIELDDLFHAVHAGEAGFFGSAFTFFGDGPRAAHVGAVDLPWWTDPDMRLDLYRPLAAATHWLDYRAWPGSPWLMHLHSVLWYGLLVALLHRTHRELGGDRRRAALAALLFGVAQAHAMNVGWVSARNSIIAAVFVTLALRLHHRWRAEGWRAGAVLGPASLAAALLANEGAVAGLGYLVAYAWVFDRGRGRARVLSLLPYLAAVLAWRGWYSAAAYGATHSGIYLDPLDGPLAYAGRTFVHAADMLAARFGIAVLDGLGAVPGGYYFALMAALPLLAGLGWLLRARLGADRTLRAWALGTLLACVTAGTVVPTDRGLMLIDIGGCLLLAELVGLGLRADARRSERIVGRVLLVLHLVIAPLLLPLRVGTTRWLQTRVDLITAALAEPGAAAGGMVVVLNAPSDLVMFYSRAQARLEGRAYPGRVSYLYAGAGRLAVARPSAHVLEIDSTHPWLLAPLDRMFRADLGFVLGQRFEAACTTAELTKLDRLGLPVRVRFTIHAERPGCRPIYMAWRGQAPEPVDLPAVGGSLPLEPVTLP